MFRYWNQPPKFPYHVFRYIYCYRRRSHEVLFCQPPTYDHIPTFSCLCYEHKRTVIRKKKMMEVALYVSFLAIHITKRDGECLIFIRRNILSLAMSSLMRFFSVWNILSAIDGVLTDVIIISVSDLCCGWVLVSFDHSDSLKKGELIFLGTSLIAISGLRLTVICLCHYFTTSCFFFLLGDCCVWGCLFNGWTTSWIVG